MSWIESSLLLCGIVILVWGYRRNHRRLLLAGAIPLALGAGLSDVVTGVHDGWNGGVPELREYGDGPGKALRTDP